MMKTDISLFTKKFCAATDFAQYPQRQPCHGSKLRASNRVLHRRFLDNRGVAAIEFAFLAPVLLFIIAGACQFSLALGNYVTLENAVHAGARQLSISRGDATPLTDTQSQFAAASGTLNVSEITSTYLVNGTACSTDATCGAALAAGLPASVSASYPCNLVVMGHDFAPGCTLTVATTERVE
jgi:Flp pilus assembly protein TadG